MNLTLQVQLLPDRDQAAALKATMERFNEAASWLASVAFERRISNKFLLQRVAYKELRERFGLPADMAIRCIAQVVEAYKRDKDKRPKFRKDAAIPYSIGKNIGFKGPDRVSIGSLNGRVVVPLVMGTYQTERLGWSKGQCDLVLRSDGKWFLLVTVHVPEGTQTPATDFIGVDLGVKNIATDSDGEIHTSEKIETKRVQYANRRKQLGKRTKGAKRSTRRHCHQAIKRTRAKEARYRRDVNHQISKRLVAKAQRTGRGIGLEDLAGIRERVTVHKQQRAQHGGWSFFQLRSFVEYKAQLAGVVVVAIDPRNTSRTCAQCSHCEKANRKSQAEFECQACGHQAHADENAARIIAIRARAVVNRPTGSERPSVASMA
jgi:IS605 OrfB family transposase